MDMLPNDDTRLTARTVEAVSGAVDVADLMAINAMTFAKEQISLRPGAEVVALAAAHLQATAMVYAVHELMAAIRSVIPDLDPATGDIPSNGLAALLARVQQAVAPKK